MRLIDADALVYELTEMVKYNTGEYKNGIAAAKLVAMDAPTVATDTNVLGKLTDEAAIEHLHKTGWMQRHDREMTRQHWISVKDRLPEPQAQCLVYSAKGSRPRGMETATYTEWGWMMAAYFPNITHWMPLPKMPEEENEDE